MAKFLMPSLGADMAAGTLIAWKIRPGDVVARGQVVAEVETDKGVIDVECFDPGTVERLVAEPGQKLPVGAVLAVIGGAAEPAAQPTPAEKPSVEKPSVEKPIAEKPIAEKPSVEKPVAPPSDVATLPAAAPPKSPHRIRATPAARKRAAELGVELAQVTGTGPDGAVELADVERAAPPVSGAAAPPQPEDGRERMRRAIAAAMSKANREIPHYYLETKIDLSRALAWLEAENARRPLAERLLSAVLSLKAVALALRDVPELNGFWINDRRQPAEGVHVGLAISMKGGGLVAPAVHDTDRKSLDELMAALHDLIPRARAGRLRSSEMTDATATLTNLGDLGVETVYGVIYPPQTALIGLGKVMPQPWVEGDALVVRPVLSATLAADHRASDGRRGAQFLEALNRRLQSPEQL